MHAAILVIEGDGIMFRPEAGLGPNATHVSTAEGTVRHIYDDRWQVIADIGAQGDVIASYVWGEGIDSLLAVKVGGESYYPLTDILGTVWGYADAANNIVARWTYDAWGNVLDEEVSVPALATLRYRFQGREWSAATGLVNFRMRWYDPETGRWLSKDPIGLSGGLNLYAFCGNDPANEGDPLGMWGVWFGQFHMGNDAPWMVFDRDSLDDLKKGFAASLDGFIPFFDPFEDVYSDECGNHDDVYDVSKIGGTISFSCLSIAFMSPSGLSLGGSSMQTVTHFSPTMQTTLKSGDWVMTGGKTFRNWLMAGAKTTWKKSLTTTVPKASLQYPPGWEVWKGLIGQRIIK